MFLDILVRVVHFLIKKIHNRISKNIRKSEEKEVEEKRKPEKKSVSILIWTYSTLFQPVDQQVVTNLDEPKDSLSSCDNPCITGMCFIIMQLTWQYLGNLEINLM
tara:strand:+ start:268 stop:582 length:315 start_codon:yes stop_codon:yes gene_type:complete